MTDILTEGALTGVHTAPDIITRTEAAKMIGIHKVTLAFLVKTRKGFPEMVALGKSKGFKRSEIEAWLNR